MQIAKPDGEILISGYVLKAVGGLCHCQPLPPVQVKGKSAPVELAALLGLAQSPAETVAYRGQMVGRQDELQKLVQFFDPILDRRNADKAHPDRLLETRSEPRFAGVATILGEAGIGKSRLAYALRQNLEYALAASPHGNGKELQWWSCPADTILGQSLYPFKYFLRPYFEQNADEPVEENRRRFEAVMDRLLQGMSAAENEDLRRQLDRTRSMLGALVDLHWEDSLYERLEPKLRFENTLLAFKALVQAESGRKPLVLHLEDAHALDPDSKALIKSLTHGVAAYPFGLLLTGRTADSGESSSDFQALDVDPQTPKLLIYLNELSVDQVCELAVQVLADAAQSEPVVVDDDLAQFLWEKTNGNPLFVEQLLLELRERKLVKLQDSRWQIECEGLAEAPDSLNALLIARLDRLEEGVKNAVKTASVIGREFEVPVLQEMLPTDDQLFTVIDVAKTEMVWAPAAGNRYAFRQSLLRDAAYYMQPASHVQSLHARAASAIQSVHPVDLSPHYADLAYHYSEAQEDGLALHYASLAGADSAARYANSQAIAYYQRALDSARRLKPAETLSARLSLHTALGELYFTIGQYQTASQHLEQALALAIECGDRDAQARACHRMGRVYESSGDYPRSLEWIQRGLDALGERKTAEMSEMLNTAGLIYSRQGDFANALLYAQRCLQIAENLDDLSAQARAYNLLGHVTHLRGDSGQAVEHFQRALALYQQANDIKGQALAHNQIANASLPLGRWQEAAHHYTLARAIFEQIGDVYNRAFADNNLGWIATNQGRLDDAVYHYQQGLATLEQIGGSPYVLGAFHNNLGATYNRRGNTQAAESAMEHLKISQAYFEQAGARDWLAELYRHQASASLLAGDVTGARAQIEQALSLARELKMRGEEGNALRVLGEVEAAGGQLDLAEEHLRQSLEILAEVGYEYEGAYSQLILVELYIRQGRSDEATPLLAQCLGIFERLGAALELERARSLL
jgi:predicted ATPase